MDFVVLDLETTGTNPNFAGISEIGMVKIRDGQFVDHFETLVNPLQPIDAFIEQYTGISDAMVADAPTLSDLSDDILQFLDGAIVIAHNKSFDLGFLNQHLFPSPISGLCTLMLSRRLQPNEPSHSLGRLIESLRLPAGLAHSAYGDALMTAHLFQHLTTLVAEHCEPSPEHLYRISQLAPKIFKSKGQQAAINQAIESNHHIHACHFPVISMSKVQRVTRKDAS